MKALYDPDVEVEVTFHEECDGCGAKDVTVARTTNETEMPIDLCHECLVRLANEIFMALEEPTRDVPTENV